MNYVYVANDGDFDVVRLDEIMAKTFFKSYFFFKIHLLIFIFTVNFLMIYKYVVFGGYTSLEIIYGPKSLWADFVMGRNDPELLASEYLHIVKCIK